jgi:hypothetical protein
MGYGEIGITLVFGTSFEGSSPSTPAMAIWWNWYTQQTQNLPDIMSLSVRVRLSLPFFLRRRDDRTKEQQCSGCVFCRITDFSNG